jgi:mRNA interferase HigB
MVIIYIGKLEDFGWKHADARLSLSNWIEAVDLAIWESKQDVLRDFPSAKMIANNRARFEIVHNKYRLIIRIIYDRATVEIRFIGTHNEYDRINPEII